MKNLKICIACSPGGHLFQARQLGCVYEQYDHFYFTFRGPVADLLKEDARVRTIPNVVRTNPLSWIWGAVSSLWIAAMERPDVIISTGAGVVVFFCVFAKLFGAKLIFIESMAKVEKPTLTARILYPISDMFFVQWPVLKSFFPKAQYLGRLI